MKRCAFKPCMKILWISDSIPKLNRKVTVSLGSQEEKRRGWVEGGNLPVCPHRNIQRAHLQYYFVRLPQWSHCTALRRSQTIWDQKTEEASRTESNKTFTRAKDSLPKLKLRWVKKKKKGRLWPSRDSVSIEKPHMYTSGSDTFEKTGHSGCAEAVFYI